MPSEIPDIASPHPHEDDLSMKQAISLTGHPSVKIAGYSIARTPSCRGFLSIETDQICTRMREAQVVGNIRSLSGVSPA